MVITDHLTNRDLSKSDKLNEKYDLTENANGNYHSALHVNNLKLKPLSNILAVRFHI